VTLANVAVFSATEGSLAKKFFDARALAICQALRRRWIAVQHALQPTHLFGKQRVSWPFTLSLLRMADATDCRSFLRERARCIEHSRRLMGTDQGLPRDRSSMAAGGLPWAAILDAVTARDQTDSRCGTVIALKSKKNGLGVSR
jgi:hypothetical protein